MIYEYPEDFLAHHGVKGMHWGVRKQRVTKGKISSNRGPRKAKKTPYDKWKRNTKLRFAASAAATAYGIGVLNGKLPRPGLVAQATYNSGKKAFNAALIKYATRPIHVKSTIRKLS